MSNDVTIASLPDDDDDNDDECFVLRFIPTFMNKTKFETNFSRSNPSN
jgi:hypothetical protein